MVEMQMSGYTVKVDDEDVDRICSRKWFINRSGIHSKRYYFLSNDRYNNRRITISLHRFLMNCTPYDGRVVDHINGDTLDNRKSNLRICTHGENVRNQRLIRENSGSVYKGVRWHKRDRIWYAGIRVNNTAIHLGRYNSPQEGAKAYDMAAIYYFGEFSRTNFPKKNYTLDQIQKFIKNNVHKLPSKGISGFWGVSYVKNNRWIAHISIKNKSTYLGTFSSPEEAAKAYDKMAIKLHGEFAYTNFPKNNYIKGATN